MQLRTDAVYRRESAGTGQIVLKVVRVTTCAPFKPGGPIFVLPFFHIPPTIGTFTFWSTAASFLFRNNLQPIRCVCVFSSHPFWTSSSLDVPAGVTQKEGHTGFLIHLPSAVRALIFVARRIQPFLSLVDREVEFCVLTN